MGSRGNIGRTMRIDVNADIGEADDADGIARDWVLFSGITSANVACGGHAGDERTMRIAVERAVAAGVSIGAHVSYPDRVEFGRRRLELNTEVLGASVITQFDALAATAAASGGAITHLKPHGALYNAMAEDAVLARVFRLLVEAERRLEARPERNRPYAPSLRLVTSLAQALNANNIPVDVSKRGALWQTFACIDRHVCEALNAGGYGERITIGLALNDNDMLLAGAIPAAVLALLTQGLFELVERWAVAGRQR